jgi:hypothetical protein
MLANYFFTPETVILALFDSQKSINFTKRATKFQACQGIKEGFANSIVTTVIPGTA